jgi:hypothetical protein
VRSLTLSAVVYLALTAIIGMDVLSTIDTHIASDPGDPLLTSAILKWNAEHVPLTDQWWQFPIFHPTTDVLAFSEHLLGLSVIATPLHWLTGNALTSYNLTLLLTYPLCGLAAYALVYWLTRNSAAAFLAGLAFLIAPVRISQLSHVHLLATFYTPLLLLGLHAFVETGRRGWLVLIGASWVLQGAVSGYFLIYGSVLAACWLLWFVVARRRWRELAVIAATLALATVPLVPVVARYVTVHARHGFSRGFAEAALFSADLTSLLCASPLLTFWGWLRVGCNPESEIFPGLALVVLCITGAVWHWRSGPPSPPVPSSRNAGGVPALNTVRRVLLSAGALFIVIAAVTALAGGWELQFGPLQISSASPAKPFSVATGLLLVGALISPWLLATAQRASTPFFYLLVALTTWVLALGTEPSFLGRQIIYEAPFAWLMRLPGGNAVRVPARFWLLTALCLAVLMGVLVAAMLKRRSRLVTAAAVAVASCGLVADGWAWIPAREVPLTAPRPDLLRGGVVLELPAGETIRDIAAVYRAVMGGWRTVNGFSGYEPGEYQQLREASAAGTVVFEPWLTRGTLHVLVSEDATALNRLVANQQGSQRIAQSGGLVQYRIERDAEP